MGNTYLVTGSAGFIGAKIAELLLSRGDTVVGLDNMNDYYSVSLKQYRVEQLQQYDDFSFYKVDIEDDRLVKVVMTVTAPGCPVAGEMPNWVRDAIATVQGVMDVEVEMTYDPPWTPERMSEEAQVALGWY